MKRFIQGEHRGQGTLLPESLDDYVSDTNPVRVVDVFVDELDLVNLGFEGAIPAETGRPADHPRDLAEDLHQRLTQPHPVEPTFGARSPAQRRTGVADRAFDAGFQDHRQLPKKQQQGHPRRLSPVRCAVPAVGIIQRKSGRDRWQSVQSSQQPRPQFHQRQTETAHGRN